MFISHHTLSKINIWDCAW